jgi:hypothetical protein
VGKLALELLVQGYGGLFHIRTYGTTHVGRSPLFVLIFSALFSVPISPDPKKIILWAGRCGESTMGPIQYNPIIRINKT